ncbi:MAG: hypothetical protein KatS3mg027_2096 [Bacteroidia bacterium]|nr:MAG: hypothetical protein KatS3mg027_2096 [Bacteroidia bacterium]
MSWGGVTGVNWDIEDEGVFDSLQVQNNNYIYNEIGNLVGDKKEGIVEIEWSMHSRIGKNIFVNPFVMAGSSTVVPIYFGRKRYELTDWLGNVRVVVSDKKVAVNSGNTTVSYLAEVEDVYDYYSFGSLINERTYNYSNGDYRFGFNGKQKDDEVYGYGNFQDYGARMYDVRLGRFVSADPLIVKERRYAYYSPYQFAGNKPIVAIDMDGLEEVIVVGGADFSNEGVSETTLKVSNSIKEYYKINGIDEKKVHVFNTYPTTPQVTKSEIIKFIKENYKPDEPIGIYAYSMGAFVVRDALDELKKSNPEINIDLFITVDPALSIWSQPMKIPSNVKTNINFYQTDSSPIGSHGNPNFAEDENKTRIINIDQTGTVSNDKSKAHGQMDEKNVNVSINLLKALVNDYISNKKNEGNNERNENSKKK